MESEEKESKENSLKTLLILIGSIAAIAFSIWVVHQPNYPPVQQAGTKSSQGPLAAPSQSVINQLPKSSSPQTSRVTH